MKGIQAGCTTTDLWSAVAQATSLEGSATYGARWMSAEQASEALNASAAIAEARAQAVLGKNPHDPQARAVLAAAFLSQRRWNEARTILQPLAETQPQMEFAWRGLGQTLRRTGEHARAILAFERALDLEIRGKEAWCALGGLLRVSGHRDERAEESAAFGLIENALAEDRIDDADRLSQATVELSAPHPVALKLRADVLIQKSRWAEAKLLLARALELAPEDVGARFSYATMLFAHSDWRECLPHIERLLGSGCDMPLLRAAKAVALAHEGRHAAAIETFESFITACPSFPGLWLEYGRVLREAGDRRMTAAFRKATQILPCFFTAWYALATVKSFQWDDTLVGEIRTQLARSDLAIEDRAVMHLVLGNALEKLGRVAEAFENFRACKTNYRKVAEHWPKATKTAWLRTRLLFTPTFLRHHEGVGCTTTDPIFIVGLPRAGSTLVEQILSAHSRVEGLGELDVLPTLVEKLYTRAGGPHRWPLLLQRLPRPDFRALGEEYLRHARALKETYAPFFTDKQPNNFQLVGLIHLMLPNAKIVDVRRHPLDCGLSCFRHFFPRGHRFACDLGDIGDRYVDYVRLMAHFDEVLPGKVHRVIYERLVDDFETEVRRLLDHVGLPFEAGCLRFFENRRMVTTLSYEQVFMPLYKSGIGQWRAYEAWLAPLKEALGPVLQAYPDVPKFFPDMHATSRAPRRLGEASGWFGNVSGVKQRPFG